VAVLIIHLFEVVDVEEQERQWDGMALGRRGEPLQLLAEAAAVGEAGEVVG
jgi:hypothetical protein